MRSAILSAFRQFRSSPGLMVATVVSLAIGIGANIVVFAWIHSVFLDPVPGAKEATALYLIHPQSPRQAALHDGRYFKMSWVEFKEMSKAAGSFSELAAADPVPLTLTEPGREPYRIFAEIVSSNYFDVLRVRPALGRLFNHSDGALSPHPGVIISYELWRSHFGLDPNVIGRGLLINKRSFPIIGVAGERFQGSVVGIGFDYWFAAQAVPKLFPGNIDLRQRSSRNYAVMVRLKAGRSPASALEDVQKIYQAWGAQNPHVYDDITVDLLPFWKNPQGAQTMMLPALATLQTLAVLVLVLTCATAVVLLLTRATARAREIAIRLALGAKRAQIFRQLAGESIIVGVAGAGLGILFSFLGVHVLAAIPVPTGYNVSLPVSIRTEEIGAAIVLALAVAVVCGIAPGYRMLTTDLTSVMKTGKGAGRKGSWFRTALVVLQVAVAMLVLVLAGLFLKSYRNSREADPGFSSDRVLLAGVDLLTQGLNYGGALAFIQHLLPQLNANPNIEAASMSQVVPLDIIMKLLPDPATSPENAGHAVDAVTIPVTPRYFDVIGIPLVAGQDFSPLDGPTHPPQAIVNEELALRMWPGAPAIGKTILIGSRRMVVVGVARDSKYNTMHEPPTACVYVEMLDQFWESPTMTLFIKTRGAPLAAEPDILQLVDRLSPGLRFNAVRTMQQHVDDNLFMARLPAWLLGTLWPTALLLAAIGVYSVVAYSVAQRSQEIAVRIALGATKRRVIGMVVQDGLRLVGVGTAFGIVLGYACSVLLSPGLVKVPPGDIAVFGPVLLMLLGVATIACWIPARRTSLVRPAQVLAAE